MIDVQLLPATEDHIQLILPNVRPADIDELYAVSLMSTEDAIRVGIRTATMAWSGFANGELVTIFGVSPASMIGGNGIPWLVSTHLVEKYQKTFLRGSRHALQAMLDVYPRLENYVDERNYTAKAWLHWLGFHLEAPAPYGALGLNFHRFHMERK
ncbi:MULTISPECIES: hypothetical protein [Enterobacteriaceae]|uniref:hypothetical protein n=1 Tax=Enterobacteriaceae TaxID=543 RepID=UPI00136596EF|nr:MULTISPECIES: hypothetical protein [Enterobacteriaceae]MDW4578486.1 hypothetical protein [Atlantibacter hermannii]MWF58232.1 hypothetical protein [Escherichia coli]